MYTDKGKYAQDLLEAKSKGIQGVEDFIYRIKPKGSEFFCEHIRRLSFQKFASMTKNFKMKKDNSTKTNYGFVLKNCILKEYLKKK